MRTVIVLAALASAAACASSPRTACAGADWRAAGFEAGARGDPLAAAERPSSCAPSQTPTDDFSHYVAGWRDGVAGYCTAANGYELGATGAEFNGVCGGSGSRIFADAFREGEAVFAARADAEAVGLLATEIERELWDIRNRIALLESELRNPMTKLAERPALLREANELRAERMALSAALQGERERQQAAQSAAAQADIEARTRLGLIGGATTPMNAAW